MAALRAIVRYVLAPRSVSLDELPWETCCTPTLSGSRVGFVVYRGQSRAAHGAIPRIGSNPLEIRLDTGRPLSTSSKLNQHIESFAAPPGRLFMIHVNPGTKYVNIRKALNSSMNTDKYFETIKAGLPPGHGMKNATAGHIRGEFWRRVAKENEIIIDPRGVVFRNEMRPETWNIADAITEAPLTEVNLKLTKTVKVGVPTGVTRPVEVYETGLFPKSGGRRGRTFRRKTLRRNKNGGRPTRQSKRHVRNGDTRNS
jgi:hypothetical protein